MNEQMKQSPREKVEAQTLGSRPASVQGSTAGAGQGPEPGAGSREGKASVKGGWDRGPRQCSGGGATWGTGLRSPREGKPMGSGDKDILEEGGASRAPELLLEFKP